MPVRYISTQLNGPWFDSRCWLCQQPEEATDGNGAKEANNINIANKAAEANDARRPTMPRRPTRGPWPRLACTEDSPLVRSAVLAQAEANDAKRLLMARRPTTPTWPWRPTMPGSQQHQGGQPGALGSGLLALRIIQQSTQAYTIPCMLGSSPPPLHLAQAGWPRRPEYGKHMIESTTNS